MYALSWVCRKYCKFRFEFCNNEKLFSFQRSVKYGIILTTDGATLVYDRVHVYMQWHRNNFESGGTGPAQKLGAPMRRKNFLVVPLHFLALEVQIVVLVSAFVMVSWYVSCLVFFYSRCPPCPVIGKNGARAPVPHGVGATVYMRLDPINRVNASWKIKS